MNSKNSIFRQFIGGLLRLLKFVFIFVVLILTFTVNSYFPLDASSNGKFTSFLSLEHSVLNIHIVLMLLIIILSFSEYLRFRRSCWKKRSC